MIDETEDLFALGFQEIGVWREVGVNLSYDRDGLAADIQPLLNIESALYAFVQGEEIKYVGKTARSARKRFVGYCNPGSSQATNRRCFDHIKHGITQGITTRIFIFLPLAQLQYGRFAIDLAAGLEESLIKAFNPPWNGGVKTKRTEEAEREEIDAIQNHLNDLPEIEENLPTAIDFTITLRETYYRLGFINPGMAVSGKLGQDGEAIEIDLGDAGQKVISRINRKANGNGSPRFVGGNSEIAEWFQAHFKLHDIVRASIIDTNRVLLRLPVKDDELNVMRP